MQDETAVKNDIVEAVEETVIVPEADVAAEAVPAAPEAPKKEEKFFGGKKRGGAPQRGARKTFAREKPEFDQKMIQIRRVTRVVAGGRRFSFSVALAIGDRRGSLGLGTGKAGDTSLAIEKAFKNARKEMITLPLNKRGSLPHDVTAKYSSASITIRPNPGRGLVAGSAARILLDLAGVKDVTTKFQSGTKNTLNNARATMKALHMYRGVKKYVSVPKVEAKTTASEEVVKETKRTEKPKAKKA